MKAFALTIFVLLLLAVRQLVLMIYLVGEHPRSIKSVNVGTDAAAVILTIVLLIWAAYLLWGVE